MGEVGAAALKQPRGPPPQLGKLGVVPVLSGVGRCQTAAVLFSFASTCRRLGVEPWAFLQDVLTRLPTTPADQVDALLPDRWQAARVAARAGEAPAPGAGGSAPPADSLH